MPADDPQPGEEWSPTHTPTVIVDHIDFRDDGLRRVYYRQHRDMEVLLLDEFLQRFNPPEVVDGRELSQTVAQYLRGLPRSERLEETRRIIHERLEARRLEREARPIAHRVIHRDPYLDEGNPDAEFFDNRVTPEELDRYTPEELGHREEMEELSDRDEDALTVEDYEAFNARLAARDRNSEIPQVGDFWVYKEGYLSQPPQVEFLITEVTPTCVVLQEPDGKKAAIRIGVFLEDFKLAVRHSPTEPKPTPPTQWDRLTKDEDE
jgi:hypothetical protein